MSEALLSYDRLNGQVLRLSNMEARDPTTQAKELLGAGANVRATVRTKRDQLPIVGLTALQFTYGSPGEFYRVLTGAELSEERDRYEVEAHGDDGDGNGFSWRRPLRVKTRRSGEPRPTGAIAAAATWDEHPDIVLLALAEDQTAGSQVVVSRIGPNGWLGELVTADGRDPTLDLTPPARWFMGQQVGQTVNFGKVLEDVFDAASGFTLGTGVELGDDALSGSGTITTLINKDRHESGTPNGGGVWLRTFADALWLEVHYDEDILNQKRDTFRWPAVLTPGQHSIVVTYDRPLATRALRARAYINGVLLPAPTAFVSGVQGDAIVTAERPLELAGFHGSGLTGPESAESLVVASGVMTQKWAGAFAADRIAAGWL